MFVRIFLILFLIIPANIFAQPFEGGFFAGLTASQIDGDTYSGYDKLGITAGGYISRGIGNRSNWKAELRYVQRGAYNKGTLQNPDFYRIILHYIELPLIIQYEIYEDVLLDFGLAPDIFLLLDEEDEFGDMPQEDRPDFHTFGLAGLAGANYKISEQLIIGARFTYSVIPIRDHPSGQTYLLNRGQYSNSLSLSFYYHFE